MSRTARPEGADEPPAGCVVVCVMDVDSFDGNTDNIVVVDPVARRVLAVPRDLWDPARRRRVNRAWTEGGFPALRDSLGSLGIQVEGGMCLRRSAVETALEGVRVTVPIEQLLRFLYPATPGVPIQEGATLVSFDPPAESLSGERLHQWLGARYQPDGSGSELVRPGRHVTLLRELIRSGADLRRVFADPDRVQVTGPDVVSVLESVDLTWRFEVLDDVLPRTVDGKEVYVLPTPLERGRHVLRRMRRFASEAVARRLPALRLPTGGCRRPRRRVRLLAAIAVRNEEAQLPDWLANVAPHVDGIVALDDGSTDRSTEILANHPSVLEVLRVPTDRDVWDEVANHRHLVRASLDHGAEWIVCLDADERVERAFRDRVERAIRRGRWIGVDAFALVLLELWDSRDRWRCDGVWKRKRPPRLFAARRDHRFDLRLLHGAKAPLQGRRFGAWVTADCRISHLHMIDPEARAARRRRYEDLDPELLWQPGGYAYLTDETGLRTRRIRPRRSHAPEG